MSARRFTLRQAAAALRQYQAGVPAIVLRQLDAMTVIAHRLAVTKYMQGLGNGDPFGSNPPQPPNSPPGPIGIRSGNLRRAVARARARRTGLGGYAAGLSVDLSKAPQGRIQEEGGRTKAHVIRPRVGKVLRWRGVGPAGVAKKRGGGFKAARSERGYRVTKDGIVKGGGIRKFGGFDIFAASVRHPGSRIPARPFMLPALREASKPLAKDLERALRELEDRIL